jgi:hypothetical protein
LTATLAENEIEEKQSFETIKSFITATDSTIQHDEYFENRLSLFNEWMLQDPNTIYQLRIYDEIFIKGEYEDLIVADKNIQDEASDILKWQKEN